MKNLPKFNTLEDDLEILLAKSRTTPRLSLREILEILSEKCLALLLIFLSIPFCLPIQIPGMSLPFGLVISLLGVRMIVKKQLWLPQFILNKTISSQEIQKIVQKSTHFLNKIKRYVHPRMSWLSEQWVMVIVNGVVVFFLGIFLALPFPIPFTNLIAAWSIVFLSIGILKDDGVFVLIGYLGGLSTLAFLIAILWAIWKTI